MMGMAGASLRVHALPIEHGMVDMAEASPGPTINRDTCPPGRMPTPMKRLWGRVERIMVVAAEASQESLGGSQPCLRVPYSLRVPCPVIQPTLEKRAIKIGTLHPSFSVVHLQKRGRIS